MGTKEIISNYYIWAQFNKQSLFAIKKIKNQVEKELNGPQFEPHLTLSGPITKFNSDLTMKLVQISNEINPVKIYSDGIVIKNLFFQSLFIKIKKENKLINLKNKIDQRLLIKSKLFYPHISLHYGDESKIDKEIVRDKLIFPNEELKINKICLVYITRYISSWKIIESCLLKKK